MKGYAGQRYMHFITLFPNPQLVFLSSFMLTRLFIVAKRHLLLLFIYLHLFSTEMHCCAQYIFLLAALPHPHTTIHYQERLIQLIKHPEHICCILFAYFSSVWELAIGNGCTIYLNHLLHRNVSELIKICAFKYFTVKRNNMIKKFTRILHAA